MTKTKNEIRTTIAQPPKYVACLHCSDDYKITCDHEPAAGMTRALSASYRAWLALGGK